MYSKEEVLRPLEEEIFSLKDAAAAARRQPPGSVAFAPSARGAIAAEVIKDIIGR